MIDLEPATTRLSELIRAVADEQPHNKTPCADMAVGELVDHVQTRSVAFAAAGSQGPDGSVRSTTTAGCMEPPDLLA